MYGRRPSLPGTQTRTALVLPRHWTNAYRNWHMRLSDTMPVNPSHSSTIAPILSKTQVTSRFLCLRFPHTSRPTFSKPATFLLNALAYSIRCNVNNALDALSADGVLYT